MPTNTDVLDVVDGGVSSPRAVGRSMTDDERDLRRRVTRTFAKFWRVAAT